MKILWKHTILTISLKTLFLPNLDTGKLAKNTVFNAVVTEIYIFDEIRFFFFFTSRILFSLQKLKWDINEDIINKCYIRRKN